MANLFSKEIETELTKIFEDVASKMGDKVAERCLASLQTQYQQIWQPFETRVSTLIHNLDQSSAKNVEINESVLKQKQNLGQEMKTLQDQLQAAMQTSVDKLEKTLIPHLDEALVGKLSQTLQNHIAQVAGQVQTVLENLQGKIDASTTQVKTALDSVATETKNVLTKLEDDTKEASERIEANYDQRLGNFFVAQKQHITNWNASLDATLKQVVDKHTTATAKIEQEIQKLQTEGSKALQALQKAKSESQDLQIVLQHFGQDMKNYIEEKLQSQKSEIAKIKGKFGLVVFMNILVILGIAAIGALMFLNK